MCKTSGDRRAGTQFGGFSFQGRRTHLLAEFTLPNELTQILAYSQNATIGTLNETAFSPSLRSGLPPALAYNEGTITDFPRPINE